jgi:quinol monooxygenase YgiN
MTIEQAIAAIQATGANLTARDIDNLTACTDAQVAYIVELWKDAARVRDKSTADEILAILQQVPPWVQVAVKIGKAVLVVFA